MKHLGCLLLSGFLLCLFPAACQTQMPREAPHTLDGTPPVPVPPQPESSLETHAEALTIATVSPDVPVSLTRDGALLTALVHNRSLDVARLGPGIAATYVPEARSQFDPIIGATISYGREKDPIVGTSSSLSTSTYNSSSTSSSLLSLYQGLNQALSRLNQTIDYIESEHDHQLDRHVTSGNMALKQELPTGTLLFLTGAVSDTDTEGATRDYRGSWAFGLRQPLLEGAGLGPNLAALRQAKAQAAKGEALFRTEVLNTIHNTELAYWDLVLSVEVRKIREFAVSLAEEQLTRTEAMLNVGKAIEGDVMASRAERASREADLTDANAAIRAANIALIHLLNPGANTPWALSFAPADPPEVAQIPLDVESSVQMALQYRPELEAAYFDERSARFAESQTRNALLPNLDITGTYGRTSQGASSAGILRHLDDSYYDEYNVGLEFETPLMNRAEKARHRRALMVTEQAERTRAEIEYYITAAVRESVIEVEKQWQRLESVTEAVRNRAEQFRVAKGRNEVGKTSILDLHIVERDYIQTQVDEITARVRYIQALTDLYAAEGTLLIRRGITLDKEHLANDDKSTY